MLMLSLCCLTSALQLLLPLLTVLDQLHKLLSEDHRDLPCSGKRAEYGSLQEGFSEATLAPTAISGGNTPA